ncbi:MAG: chloromuconate cycloisomerase [Acidimicrobiia bacterium]|nr:chloromuconate cycloisomerase [Acidimicrobiia bacterium]
MLCDAQRRPALAFWKAGRETEQVQTLTVKDITTTIIDVPSIRPHRFAGLEINQQAYLLVRLETGEGAIGIGEGVSPGGPWWSGEAIETQQAMIDHHFLPALQELGPVSLPTVVQHLDAVAYGNHFAKAAVEMALFDALGRQLGLPVSTLLGGGPARDRIPVRWAVGAADIESIVQEVREKLDQGHTALKLKMGAVNPEDDVKRVAAVVDALGPDVDYLVDPNASWPLETARWVIDELETIGVSYVEQPIRRDDLEGLAHLTSRATRISLIADESVCTPSDALRATRTRTCDGVAVKVAKAGGLLRGLTVGQIAAAAGLGCYGGTALESPIGTAASAHLFAALPQLDLGTELVGPLLLAEEILVEPLEYENGDLVVPQGPGLGIEVDWDKVAEFQRPSSAG